MGDNYLDIIENAADTLDNSLDDDKTKTAHVREVPGDDLVTIYKVDGSNRPCGVKPRHRQYKYEGGGSLRVEARDADLLVRGGEWAYGG